MGRSLRSGLLRGSPSAAGGSAILFGTELAKRPYSTELRAFAGAKLRPASRIETTCSPTAAGRQRADARFAVRRRGRRRTARTFVRPSDNSLRRVTTCRPAAERRNMHEQLRVAALRQGAAAGCPCFARIETPCAIARFGRARPTAAALRRFAADDSSHAATCVF